MSFRVKKILLCLFILFTFSAAKAQVKLNLPIVQTEKNEFECGLVSPPIVQINVSVLTKKIGFLKSLSYKNFEVYDEKEFQEIEFFKFEELRNQYIIGFYQNNFPSDDKWHDIKVKVKLSKKKNKDYGKIFVEAPKGYYSNKI